MRVRQAVWLSAIVIAAVTAAAVIILFQMKLLPRFQSLEEDLVERSAHQVHTMMDNNLNVISAKLRSLATWDLAYEYSLGRIPRVGFEAESLNDSALANEDYDAFIWLGPDHRIIFARFRSADPEAPYGRLPDEIAAWLTPEGELTPVDDQAVVTGYKQVQGRPVLAVSVPVLPHSYKPPAAGGRVIALSYFNEAMLQNIVEFTGLNLKLLRAEDTPEMERWDRLAGSNNIYTYPETNSEYAFIDVIDNLSGRPYSPSRAKLTGRWARPPGAFSSSSIWRWGCVCYFAAPVFCSFWNWPSCGRCSIFKKRWWPSKGRASEGKPS